MPKKTRKTGGSKSSDLAKRAKISVECDLQAFYNDLDPTKYRDVFTGNKDSVSEHGNLVAERKPFPHCHLKHVVNDDFLPHLTRELDSLKFRDKNNDLYKFRQSDELNSSPLPHIAAFRNLLLDKMRPIISQISGLELNEQISLFCAKYTYTDHLLCHDDELEGRVIAFIYYLVPEGWTERDGGNLELFSTDESGEPANVAATILPAHNSLAFFQVSPVSFHQVSEIFNKEYTRLSIGGWFHGKSPLRPVNNNVAALECFPHKDIEEQVFFSMINPVFLNPSTQAEIQEKFEESSEICLPDFLNPTKFQSVSELLAKSNLSWKDLGPVNRRKLQILVEETADSDDLADLLLLFKSEPFFLFLSNLTGLRLHKLAPTDSDEEEHEDEDGHSSRVDSSSSSQVAKEVEARCRGNVRKWERGCYTLIRDDDTSLAEFALDARMFFNCAGWESDMGGQTIYLARDEDEELITVEPCDNSLNLVYRDKYSLRFVKYVNAKLDKIGCFHDVEFSYYE